MQTFPELSYRMGKGNLVYWLAMERRTGMDLLGHDYLSAYGGANGEWWLQS
jgi:hypothetical protein